MKQQKKLLQVHERVEVRQLEEGLRGSWHSGKVVATRRLCRSVKYDHLLSADNNAKSKLLEHIPVSKAVDDASHSRVSPPPTYRGRIRPLPPVMLCSPTLVYGLCVDAFYHDAWWEGVLFDTNLSSPHRSVFFPDEGDQRSFSVKDLRVTYEWDEYLGGWRDRGTWIITHLLTNALIKNAWFLLRDNLAFKKHIAEWTCGDPTIWTHYLRDLNFEIPIQSTNHSLHPPNTSWTNSGHLVSRKRGREPKTSHHVHPPHQPSAQLRNIMLANTPGQLHLDLHTTIPDPPNIQPSTSRLTGSSKKSRLLDIEMQLQPQATSPPNIPFRPLRKSRRSKRYGQSETAVVPGAKSDKVSARKETSSPLTKETSNQDVGKRINSKNLLRTSVSVKTQSSRKLILIIPKHQKQTLKKRTKLEKLLPINGKLNDKSSIADSDILKAPSLMQDNISREGGIESICLSVKTKRKRSCALRKTKRQPMKKESNIRKSSSIRAKDKGERIKKRLASDNLVMRETQSVTERKNLLTSVGDSCSPSQQRERNECIENHLVAVERGLKTSKWDSVDMRSYSIRQKKVRNSPLKEDTEFVTRRRRSVPFANFDKDISLKDMVSHPRKRRRRYNGRAQSDTVCMVCQVGGDLILCDHCPSTYHMSCIGLKDVPAGKWFCPSCRCGECGTRDSDSDIRPFTSVCHQCSRQYHLDCLSRSEMPSAGNCAPKEFCSQKCFEIFQHLHQLIGKSNPTCVEGFSWSIIRSKKNDFPRGTSKVDNDDGLSRALKIMHECFERSVDPHTNRDLVKDIIFNRVSKLKRLDFHGFYTMFLQKRDDIISVATVRIFGERVAEMPLIATCFQYRQQGMCRLLVNELEKMLSRLGIERLLLPAIPLLKETWKTTFSFTEVSPQHRIQLLGYPILGFSGTTLCQKFLTQARETSRGTLNKPVQIVPEFSSEKQVNPSQKETVCQSRTASVGTFKYVYKRRRILANENSFGSRIN